MVWGGCRFVIVVVSSGIIDLGLVEDRECWLGRVDLVWVLCFVRVLCDCVIGKVGDGMGG